MDYLPIFINIRGEHCLVVGGGDIAARKAALLRQAGAHVVVVAPEICPSLQQLADAGDIDCHSRRFEPDDLAGCRLVIAATNVAEVNSEVSRLAQARQLPVNVVDQPGLCSFIVPSIIDR